MLFADEGRVRCTNRTSKKGVTKGNVLSPTTSFEMDLLTPNGPSPLFPIPFSMRPKILKTGFQCVQ